jgi:hypothetical protein
MLLISELWLYYGCTFLVSRNMIRQSMSRSRMMAVGSVVWKLATKETATVCIVWQLKPQNFVTFESEYYDLNLKIYCLEGL